MAAVAWVQKECNLSSPSKHDMRFELADNQTLYSDKLLLAMLSPVFARILFDQEGVDVQQQRHKWSSIEDVKKEGLISGVTVDGLLTVVRMPHCQKSVIEAVLRFMYSGSLNLTEDNISSMIEIAYQFDMQKVKDAICDFLAGVTQSDAFFGYYSLLEPYTELQEALHESFAAQHTHKLINNQQFNLVSPEFIRKIVAAKHSVSCTEEELFLAVAQWSVYECARRGLSITRESQREVLDGILYNFRLPLLTFELLGKEILPLGILNGAETASLFSYFSKKSQDVLFTTTKRIPYKREGKTSAAFTHAPAAPAAVSAAPVFQAVSDFVPVVHQGPICPACTFANQEGAYECEICGSELE